VNDKDTSHHTSQLLDEPIPPPPPSVFPGDNLVNQSHVVPPSPPKPVGIQRLSHKGKVLYRESFDEADDQGKRESTDDDLWMDDFVADLAKAGQMAKPIGHTSSARRPISGNYSDNFGSDSSSTSTASDRDEDDDADVNWETCYDDKTGLHYFYNTKTLETMWAETEEEAAAVPGWTRLWDSTSRRYYWQDDAGVEESVWA
jgi:hypothetical protein